MWAKRFGAGVQRCAERICLCCRNVLDNNWKGGLVQSSGPAAGDYGKCPAVTAFAPTNSLARIDAGMSTPAAKTIADATSSRCPG